MIDITQEIQMFFYFGYVLPAILFFILNCWDEIYCSGVLTLRAVLWSLGCSIVPLLNIAFFFGISWHLFTKHITVSDFINLDFVIYRRKK
jgi:hypothetical protein